MQAPNAPHTPLLELALDAPHFPASAALPLLLFLSNRILQVMTAEGNKREKMKGKDSFISLSLSQEQLGNL